MKITLLIFLLSVFLFKCFGQQESQYTQYMYNTLSINPGYAGTRGLPSVFGLYRTQWVGLDGAPTTANFSIESPVTENGQGVGISLINDQIGPSTQTIIMASYSYPIQLSSDIVMSLGISGSLEFMTVDFNKLDVYDPDDPFLSGVLNKTSPNIGAGVYFHSDHWYSGLSIPQILETKFYDDVKVSVASQKMHFYAIAGYVFDLSPNTKLKPAALVKVVSGAPIAVDVSANFLFMEKLTLGVAYRWDASFEFIDNTFITEKENNYRNFDRLIFVIYDKFELIEFLKLYKKGINVLICVFNKRLYCGLSFLEEFNDLFLLDGSKTRNEIISDLKSNFTNLNQHASCSVINSQPLEIVNYNSLKTMIISSVT